MHEVAEHGIAAHYRYKEGDRSDPGFDDRMNWMRELLDLNLEDAGSEAFIESVEDRHLPRPGLRLHPEG